MNTQTFLEYFVNEEKFVAENITLRKGVAPDHLYSISNQIESLAVECKDDGEFIGIFDNILSKVDVNDQYDFLLNLMGVIYKSEFSQYLESSGFKLYTSTNRPMDDDEVLTSSRRIFKLCSWIKNQVKLHETIRSFEATSTLFVWQDEVAKFVELILFLIARGWIKPTKNNKSAFALNLARYIRFKDETFESGQFDEYFTAIKSKTETISKYLDGFNLDRVTDEAIFGLDSKKNHRLVITDDTASFQKIEKTLDEKTKSIIKKK